MTLRPWPAAAFALFFLLGCKSSERAVPVPAAEAPAAAENPSEPSAPAAERPARPAPQPASISERDLCANAGLLLTAHRFEDLAAGGYCDLCKVHDEMACELDWPSSDVMACPEWDVMRNTIYARYGKAFDKLLWQAYFARQPWYAADPSFDAARLPAVAVENVAYLLKAGEACRAGCKDHGDEGICVSLADYLEAAAP